jgi:hypothetical protein
VKRSLDLIPAPRSPSYACVPTSLSHLMTGNTSLPPGLRFPTGSVVGNHLIVSGTFLSSTSSCFAIWALDLGKSGPNKGTPLVWQKVDPGVVMSCGGSWNKAVTWKNNVVVLGDRDRDIAADYDHRQTNFVHVAFVDLEVSLAMWYLRTTSSPFFFLTRFTKKAYGIYQPPMRALPLSSQEFGLITLRQPYLSDFELVCSDGKRLGCSRRLLEDRWPWFRHRLAEFKDKAKGIYAAQQRNSTDGVDESDGASANLQDLRISPRTLHLPEPSPVALALLQYLYTLSLCTSHQHQLPILTSLLLFSRTYQLHNLRALVTHALHGCLSEGSGSAAHIYEAATLSGCVALQVRSLKHMMVRVSLSHLYLWRRACSHAEYWNDANI